MSGGFGTLDWIVLGGYFVLLAITGFLFSRRGVSTHDYFLGGGRIPMWAAAISLLATALSAATFVGGPQQSYDGNLSYLSANIGALLAVVVVALYFVPAFYRHKVATVYGLLGVRFGAPAALAASGAFIIGRVLASGARLYIAALPASLIVFGDVKLEHQACALAVLTVVGSVYTLAGGMRSVIWTDVVQTIIFVGAALAAFMLLWHKIPLNFSEITEALRTPGNGAPSKLTILPLGLDGFDPKHSYTLMTAIFGFTLINLGAYGTDQDLVQRTLSCRSAAKGSGSTIMAILLSLPVTVLFMGIGLLLYIFYARPDLMGVAAPTYAVEGGKTIFLTFMLHELPPGMAGVMMAGLLAVSLSSLISALNALSSSAVNDFYRRFRPNRPDAHYLFMGRAGVLGFGLLLGGVAILSMFWQEAHPKTMLIDFAFQVMLFAYSGLVAVFLAALFTRRGNSASVIAALLVGFGTVVGMQYISWNDQTISQQLAYPWQMLLATSAAFGVCCLGTPVSQSVSWSVHQEETLRVDAPLPELATVAGGENQ